MSKLIRDKIPEIMVAKKAPIKTRILGDGEYLAALHDKLFEEVQEFVDAVKNNESELEQQKEIADVLEVIAAICVFKGYDDRVIQRVREEKLRERGGFEKRIFLITGGAEQTP